MAADWPGGVWWVDLTEVVSGVADAVADALGVLVEHQVGSAGSIAATIADRQVLLVLDSCEHVADEVVELVDELAARCPAMHGPERRRHGFQCRVSTER